MINLPDLSETASSLDHVSCITVTTLFLSIAYRSTIPSIDEYVCMFVSLHAYLKNHNAELCRYFVHVDCSRGIVCACNCQ